MRRLNHKRSQNDSLYVVTVPDGRRAEVWATSCVEAAGFGNVAHDVAGAVAVPSWAV